MLGILTYKKLKFKIMNSITKLVSKYYLLYKNLVGFNLFILFGIPQGTKHSI